MLTQFPPDRDFLSLGAKDLLEARDAYHVHLSHLDYVVGTAVGKYLIHEEDWEATHPPDEKPPKEYVPPTHTYERTLFNTLVKPWSWPCVLVFVREWAPQEEFAKSPDQMVPRALFLPDGRVVPTCVVRVVQVDAAAPGPPRLSFPKSRIGGGYLALTEVQGRQHVASIGCLVTDGDLTYALTNRHVTGEDGREIYTLLRGRKRRIGVSDKRQIDRRPFQDVYRGWAGGNVLLNLDAGLIRIDNISEWTSQVVSMGTLDEVLDLSTDTLTLDLIDAPVRAFGGASGELFGHVAALFYRYRSVGGADYVTDFLIRPREDSEAATLRGDSGTLWFWEQPASEKENGGPRRRPFAVQWGGHAMLDDSGASKRARSFALATSLSVICRELGVTVIRDWNSGLPEYWGDIGHYSIAFFACSEPSGKLGGLMMANREIVSYPESKIRPTLIKERGPDGFVPLADVPDRIWKVPKATGFRGPNEGPSHFADMDRPLPDNPNKGKTLLELCKTPANIDPQFWEDYYTRVKDRSKGLLPFRVWQFYDEMVDAAGKRDIDRFVCAAGIAAHYVADACQPLHISYLFDGDPDDLVNGEKRGKKVHSAFDDAILRAHSAEMLELLRNALQQPPSGPLPAPPSNGQAAAVAVVELMRRTMTTVKPGDVIDAFVEGEDLWSRFSDQTIQVMADGTRTLAAIWLGAWNKGNGNKIPQAEIKPADLTKLMELYERKDFVPSVRLKDIGSYLSPPEARKRRPRTAAAGGG
jgi:hypothetical protein